MLDQKTKSKELRLIAKALRECADMLNVGGQEPAWMDEKIGNIARYLHDMVHAPEKWPRPPSFYDLMAEAEACGEDPVEGARRRHRSGVTSTKHVGSERHAKILRQRMIELGISVFEPDVIGALEAKLASKN
jgi:hypothetical protein